MRLNDKLIEDRDFLRRPLTRELKRAITAIPTNVRSFKLERASIERSSDDETKCYLYYRSSLCGIPNENSSIWLYNPQIYIHTKINSKIEGYHEITWVILELTHDQDMAQGYFDAMPIFQKYNLNTIKGYIQAVDKMARLLGWKKKEEPAEQNNSVDKEAKQ